MAEMVEAHQKHRTGAVARTLITVYGTLVYVTFLIVFLYAIGWVEGLVVPHTINDGPDAPVAAGGTLVTKATRLFWGDLVGRVRDPFGNLWWVWTHQRLPNGLSLIHI